MRSIQIIQIRVRVRTVHSENRQTSVVPKTLHSSDPETFTHGPHDYLSIIAPACLVAPQFRSKLELSQNECSSLSGAPLVEYQNCLAFFIPALFRGPWSRFITSTVYEIPIVPYFPMVLQLLYPMSY